MFGALYQIRVRIGASIGEVTMGSFGPAGARQWDVIGDPVIEAKRMETTAPIGGLRISARLYEILESSGKVDEYYQRFKREALVLSSRYRTIEKGDLFRKSSVLLKDKGDVTFDTYKVQVAAQLPNEISAQVKQLFNKQGVGNTSGIMDLLQYYRGNEYVITAMEDTFRELNIHIRKGFILETMYPKQFEAIKERFDGDMQKVEEHIDSEFTLFDLLDRLGRFQDLVKQRKSPTGPPEFESYNTYMDERVRQIRDDFTDSKGRMVQRSYFYRVVFPLVLESIESSIRERLQERQLTANVEELTDE